MMFGETPIEPQGSPPPRASSPGGPGSGPGAVGGIEIRTR